MVLPAKALLIWIYKCRGMRIADQGGDADWMVEQGFQISVAKMESGGFQRREIQF